MRYLAVIILFSGCATPSLEQVAVGNQTLAFRPSQRNPDVLVYRHPTKRVRDYTSFLVAPVEIESQADYHSNQNIEAETKTLFSEAFRTEVVDALKGYPLATNPGEATLRVQARVRDIHPAHWELDENRFLLLRFDTKLESATMEVTCFDSLSGEPVLALIHRLRGTVYWKEDDVSRLETLRDAFRAWAKSLRRQLDAVK